MNLMPLQNSTHWVRDVHIRLVMGNSTKWSRLQLKTKKRFAAEKKLILIAPSWGENNILSTIGHELITLLINRGFHVVVRPHPSFFYAKDSTLVSILSRFEGHPNVTLERSTGTSSALWMADVLVADYSGFALEYAALRKRPCVYVDVTPKVLNQSWKELGVPAVEIDHRKKIGTIVPPCPKQAMAAVQAAVEANDLTESVISDFVFPEPTVGKKAAFTLKHEFPEIYQ